MRPTRSRVLCPIVVPGLAAMLGACDDTNGAGHDTRQDDATDETAADTTADTLLDIGPPPRALGLNDVSMLLPLPNAGVGSLVPVGDLVPADLFARLVTDSQEVFTDHERMQVVAVRFDLCDRIAPGACPEDADGSVRIVLQPLHPEFGAEDVALHAFYPIPNAELAEVVAELRALATLADIPPSEPLGVSPALVASPPAAAYRADLRALVTKYARADRLLRLTLFAQFSVRAALVWLFRGVVKEGGAFAPIPIPDVANEQQDVLLLGRSSYQVDPLADAPAGFALAIDENAFAAAASDAQRAALDALDAIDDPLAHTAETVQCASCHITSNIRAPRMQAAGLAESEPWPLGDPETRIRTLRAFGYLRETPIASQRVVNESRQVVREIDARFP